MQTRNQIQDLYTNRASTYERFFVNFLGWGRELKAFFGSTNYIHPNFKILDAGCGTGIVTRILYQLAREKEYEGIRFHAFDLTQNMLEIFREWIVEQGAKGIEVKQADALEIEALPSHWKEYDLIITSTMLEYLPKDKVMDVLASLKKLLKDGGIILLILTRRNMITRWLAGKWWKTNLYQEAEIKKLFQEVGFAKIELKKFPSAWSNFILVVEAKNKSKR